MSSSEACWEHLELLRGLLEPPGAGKAASPAPMNRTQVSSPAQRQHLGAAGLLLLSVATTAPCCLFLLLNGTMLVSLRSRSAFRASPRYLLLCTLLLADTLQLAHSQALFLLSACGLRLPLALCAALTALNLLPHVCSPLTLVLMCVERYVAVCWPLRHAAVVTVRNTELSVCVLWTCGSLHSLALLGLALRGGASHTLMSDFCGRSSVFVDAAAWMYDRASTYVLFSAAAAAVCFCYLGISRVARSASSDRGSSDRGSSDRASSAQRACRTLLLHMLQLGLGVCALVHGPLLAAAAGRLGRLQAVSVQIVLYMGLIILPKCLSPLIYGLRDQTLRPVLMLHLRWGCRRLSVVRT